VAGALLLVAVAVIFIYSGALQKPGTNGGAQPLSSNPDYAHMLYNDPALLNCQNVQACLDRKSWSDELQRQEWAKVQYDSKFFADCMGYAPCVDRNNQRSALSAVQDWSRIEKNDPMLQDCMAYQRCVWRKKELLKSTTVQHSGESLEELGSYTWCKDSPNPRLCLDYKRQEGIKDGPSR
jgi:hypothetical protein